MNSRVEHHNFILWIMGPTSSGKTTLAVKLLQELRQKGRACIHFDGDEIRDLFGPDFGFEKKDRLRVIKTLVHLGNKAFESGLNVIISALTAHQDARDYIKQNVKKLLVLYLNCSIEKCAERDPKGLYKKAINGEIQTLIGLNSIYDSPEHPDIIINTEDMTVETCVSDIMYQLKGSNII